VISSFSTRLTPFASLCATTALLLPACVAGSGGGGGGVYAGTSGGAASSSGGGSSSGSTSSSGSSSSGSSSSGSSSSGGGALFNFGPVKLVDWDRDKDGKWEQDKDHTLMTYKNGRLHEVIEINHIAPNKPVKDDVQRFEYDANGRVAKIIGGDHNNEKSPYVEERRWVATRRADGKVTAVAYDTSKQTDPSCKPTADKACARTWTPYRKLTFTYDASGRLQRVERTSLTSPKSSISRYEYGYDSGGRITRWTRSSVDKDGKVKLATESRVAFDSSGHPTTGSTWAASGSELKQLSRMTFKTGSDGRLLEELTETAQPDGSFKPYRRWAYTYNGDRMQQRSRFSMKDGKWTESDRDTVEHSSTGSSYTFERDLINVDGAAWSPTLVTHFGRVVSVRPD